MTVCSLIDLAWTGLPLPFPSSPDTQVLLNVNELVKQSEESSQSNKIQGLLSVCRSDMKLSRIDRVLFFVYLIQEHHGSSSASRSEAASCNTSDTVDPCPLRLLRNRSCGLTIPRECVPSPSPFPEDIR